MEKYPQEQLRTGAQRLLDQQHGAQFAEAVVLLPSPGRERAEAGWNVGCEIHNCLIASDGASDGWSIEQIQSESGGAFPFERCSTCR
jgi:hypothetical protein